MKTLLTISIFSLFFLSLNAQRAGDLYTDFSEDGYYQENWEDTTTISLSMGMLSDGSIIVPGALKTTSDFYNVLTLKLDEQGRLAPFGNFSRGFVLDLADIDIASSVVVLPGDTILIAGVYAIVPNVNYPFIVKLLPNGQLDENFGDDGVFSDESVSMDVTRIGIYQKEGGYSIILSGSNVDNHPILMMLDNKGIRDPSFDSDGIFLASSLLGYFNDISIDNENNILYVCGSIDEGGGFLAELNLPDGSPLTSFGMGGILEFTPADDFSGTFKTIAVDPEDNTIIVMGSYPHAAGDQDIFAYRVDASDGSADASFGDGGLAVLRSPVSDEYIKSVILQSDGKYYFGGYSDFSGTRDFLIGRINHNGFGDTTFGTNGLVLTDLGSNEMLFKLLLNPEEDILYAVGYSYESVNDAITIVAYYTTSYSEPPISIEDSKYDALTCYPNPSKGIVTIEAGIEGSQQVQIYDMAGRQLYEEICTGERFDLNLELLQPSVYILKITLPDKYVMTSKLIKQ